MNGLDPTGTYQWLVRRGRIGIWIDGDRVVLEVDPGEAPCCLLTTTDVKEVAGILFELPEKQA
jgi:hypothetical protein